MSITIFIGDKDMWISSKLLFLVTLSFTLYACKPKEYKQNKQQETDIQFINNRDLHYKILNIACDSCFPIHDIGYRVRIKLSNKEDSIIKTIKRETWLSLLQDSTTDYATNALLYGLYDRDAIVLLCHRDINDWRLSMKENDLIYWKKHIK